MKNATTTLQNRSWHQGVKIAAGLVSAALVMSTLAACGSAKDPAQSLDDAEIQASAKGLDEQFTKSCKSVFDQSERSHNHMFTLVYDGSASVTGNLHEALPANVAKAIAVASMHDDGFNLIAVDGADSAPRIVMKNASLRQAVAGTSARLKTAKAIPACVAQKTEELKPTSSGTDLGRAVALAAETLRKGDTLGIVSDWMWTSGVGGLTDAAVKAGAKDAADASAQSQPIDLKGADLVTGGVAETSTMLPDSGRTWMRDYARALCSDWKAGGCQAISLDPLNATKSEGLPEDSTPFFPIGSCKGGAASYELGNAYFAADSPQLTEEAYKALADPVNLMKANPASTLTIVGHTASVSKNANSGMQLSVDRAKAVAQVFTGNGIDAKRISATGVGDSQPRENDLNADGTQNESVAQRERRVDITVEGVSQCLAQ
ncbi:OmpA family protein [Bifidobacterium sp. ESL0728]|uniref:OmpA family protein n=1 Tax=Bifidobacterium sp. ESL0728 TaxID=2983220 RepID=UPI0023F8BE68|nr:OmpA family protein [Bifidobacterium sp. ESL0728]WEV59392.1 OmpA family protein [Bifidobacterium sp. ESL0728]